jgi:hypothetical protein
MLSTLLLRPGVVGFLLLFFFFLLLLLVHL